MPRFTLYHRGQVVRSFIRDEARIRVGRLAGLEVVLDSPTVSREHAILQREPGGYALEDLGSVNGVRLNGRRVKRHALAAGDRIEIEDFLLVFEPDEAAFVAGLDPAIRACAERMGGADPALTFLNIGRILGDKNG